MVIKKDNWQKWIFYLVFLSIFFLYWGSTLKAQTRRALLVGINNYEPKEVPKSPCRKECKNLCGCINDVEAMKGILASSRFGFKQEDIHVLKNEEATRERILADFKKYLVDSASAGDICLFYYAGHGSRVKNSMSDEPDKMDETLVPADWYRGVKDIRDKELKKRYNQVLDKQAHLTVIIDACHSGSSSRGIPDRLRYRSLPPNLCDAAEPPDREKSPAERGALIFSAAQDFQGAGETEDENNNCYGLFTWALIKVLKDFRGTAPARDILLKVKAIMQSEGRLQEPNLEALPEKARKSILGIQAGGLSGSLKVAVSQVVVRSQLIELEGGFAVGIRKDCELKKIDEKNGDSVIRVRVTAINGLNRCTAKVIQGEFEKINEGDFFELDKWVAAREAQMQVRIPASHYSFNRLTRIARRIAELRGSHRIRWIEDPTVISPTHIISWHQSTWRLQILTNGDFRIVKLGRSLRKDMILEEVLKNHSSEDIKPCVFLQLPLSVELDRTVNLEMEEYHHSIRASSSDEGVHYILVGRFTGKRIEYAWVLPNMTQEEKQDFSLPIRTRWIATGQRETGFQQIAEKLTDKILQLVRIRAWFQLSSPPGNGRFPYQLALKNAETGEITMDGPLIEGEIYGLVLKADEARFKSVKSIEKRYVYVFSIDSNGKGTLLFPRQIYRNTENYFPAMAGDYEDDELKQKFFGEVSRVQGNEQSAKRRGQSEYTIHAVRKAPCTMRLPPGEIELGSKTLFSVGEPFGVDTFILLTTTDAISHPWVLDFSGVRQGRLTGELSPF